MAFQKGIVKVKGKMDDIIFKQTRFGYIAHVGNTITADRVRTDPSFQRTRENGQEFGRANKAAKTLRKALRILLQRASDNAMGNRLTREMMKVIKGDTVSARGQRTVTHGTPGLLKDFQFNITAPIEHTFAAAYTTAINRATGETTVNIPAFNPSQVIVAPPGATHCRIVTAGIIVDFDGQVHAGATSRSQDIDVKAAQQNAVNHLNAVTPAGTAPIFVALGVEFYEKVNGIQYVLSNGTFNTLAIVAVDPGAGASQLSIAEIPVEEAEITNQPI